jgi:hypothetical protein
MLRRIRASAWATRTKGVTDDADIGPDPRRSRLEHGERHGTLSMVEGHPGGVLLVRPVRKTPRIHHHPAERQSELYTRGLNDQP